MGDAPVNEHEESLKTMLANAYRPDPQTVEDALNFDDEVHRKIRRSVTTRVAMISAIVCVLAFFSWRVWDRPMLTDPVSVAHVGTPAYVTQQQNSSESWLVSLDGAWDDLDDLTQLEDIEFDEADTDQLGLDLPDTMWVIAGIVELTHESETYQ